MSYEEACRRAATDQGLDPIVAELAAAGITHHVEQTGGFTMVAVVPLFTTRGAWVGITSGDPGWFVVGYDSDEDEGTVVAESGGLVDVQSAMADFGGSGR